MPRRQTDPLIWTNISVRIERTMLRDLKVVAVEADTTVNNLILDGIHHVLSVREGRTAKARNPSRFLQSPSARNLAAQAARPSRIGPAEFNLLGAMVEVRCPQDLDPLMRKAGGMWEPGSRRWLIERRRINPLVRNLRRATDPLFRQAGMDLDGEGAP